MTIKKTYSDNHHPCRLCPIDGICDNPCNEYLNYKKFIPKEKEVGKDYVYQCPQCGWTDFLSNIPKEKEMEKQKFQFESEEQARDVYRVITPYHSDAEIMCAMDRLKEKGYIRKSELQTLVEGAEEMCRLSSVERDLINGKPLNIIDKCRDAIQALKIDHPEFKL
jgi:hypothetical protein